jgi:hypothetical protein
VETTTGFPAGGSQAAADETPAEQAKAPKAKLLSMDLREKMNFRDIRTLLNMTWVTTQTSIQSARQEKNDPEVRNLPGSTKKIFRANWSLAGRNRLEQTLIGLPSTFLNPIE